MEQMTCILLIDDDEDMLMLCKMWLKKAGYSVITATSGAEGIELIKSSSPALVLLDYAMPGMNGIETLKAIRSDDAIKNTPVIFRTGVDDGSMTDEINELGPQGILPKSEGKAALLSAVADLVSK